MPEMGGRLSSGVSGDTALASSGASCVAMLADRCEKVGCSECSHLACGVLWGKVSPQASLPCSYKCCFQSHPVNLSLGLPLESSNMRGAGISWETKP